MTHRRSIRQITLGAGVALVIGLGTVAAAIPAQAAETGKALNDYCYTTGTSIYNNPFWDYVYDTATGVSGYVTEYYLTDQSQTKHC